MLSNGEVSYSTIVALDVDLRFIWRTFPTMKLTTIPTWDASDIPSSNATGKVEKLRYWVFYGPKHHICCSLDSNIFLLNMLQFFMILTKSTKVQLGMKGSILFILDTLRKATLWEQRLKLHHSLLKSWSNPNFFDLTACSSTGCAVNLKCQWNSHTFLYRAIKF